MVEIKVRDYLTGSIIDANAVFRVEKFPYGFRKIIEIIKNKSYNRIPIKIIKDLDFEPTIYPSGGVIAGYDNINFKIKYLYIHEFKRKKYPEEKYEDRFHDPAESGYALYLYNKTMFIGEKFYIRLINKTITFPNPKKGIRWQYYENGEIKSC